MKFFVLPELELHFDPKSMDGEFYKDYTKKVAEEPDIACEADEVVLRNMVSGAKYAVY